MLTQGKEVEENDVDLATWKSSRSFLKMLTFRHSASSEQWGRTGSGDTEKAEKEKNLARFMVSKARHLRGKTGKAGKKGRGS